jgi:hypothetical protein
MLSRHHVETIQVVAGSTHLEFRCRLVLPLKDVVRSTDVEVLLLQLVMNLSFFVVLFQKSLILHHGTALRPLMLSGIGSSVIQCQRGRINYQQFRCAAMQLLFELLHGFILGNTLMESFLVNHVCITDLFLTSWLLL